MAEEYRDKRIVTGDIGILNGRPNAQELAIEAFTELERKIRSGELDLVLVSHLSKYRKRSDEQQ